MATIYTRGWNESGGLLTTSERFQASDGRSYKWRVDGRDFTSSLWFHDTVVIHR
ncbi:hypothetical protein BD779DRAFT_1524604 [Infundibulicybe gibba]|nr:hypothetical protein BD779DRAFT_1524604 [Infundibulicybe gibba]